MPLYPNPAGGSMEVANRAAAEAAGWTPSMGTFGAQSAETGGGGNPGTPGGPVGRDIEGSKLILQDAQNKAQQAYYNSMLRHEGDKLAFEKARQAWQETIDKAGLTGMFEGAPTLEAMMGYAGAFGTWGAPQQGQQTLEAQQQAFNQALANAGLLGTYQGQQTQQAQEQAFRQMLAQQQEARALAEGQQKTSLGYLDLLGQMRGPQNYFQYQNVLGATPGGMRDLVAAAMGQYIPGGGATTGVQPVAQSLQGMYGDITGQGYGQGAPGTAAGGYGTQVYQQQQAAHAQNMPAPNQIAPQAWNNLAPSQRQLAMSAYENQGWNAEDVKALFEQSLPKYGAQTPGAGQFKLV